MVVIVLVEKVVGIIGEGVVGDDRIGGRFGEGGNVFFGICSGVLKVRSFGVLVFSGILSRCRVVSGVYRFWF